jgi:hypothetical protein
VSDDDLETKTEVMTCAVEDAPKIYQKYSSWTKTLKVVAWIVRFTSACRAAKDQRAVGLLTPNELDAAARWVLIQEQAEAFPGDLRRLKLGQPVLAASRLSDLNPCMKDGLLLLDGRTPPNEPTQWTPVILPSKGHVTSLIVLHCHNKQGHVGVEQTLAATRRQYWILRGRATVKAALRQCWICRRYKSQPKPQMMGPLISPQLTPDEYPFRHVGVDYFGPFSVKIGRSRYKRYVCIFTCLKMRAVHLEVAHDMSTDSFLAAFARFAARRGYPTNIYSDNGTNFVGAEKEIRTLLESMDQDIIRTSLLGHGIEWHFNPPHSSHKGGLWERLIRSVRRILSTMLKDQATTEECLVTFMTEVERVMNDRPLTPVSSDPRDPNALTPNHLLLLRGVPNIHPAAEPRDAISRRWWRQARHLSDVFWIRWLKEYVPLLHRRQKWRRITRNFIPGDVVLMNDNSPRGQWPLGLVTNALQSTDGLVRTCEVKTASGTYLRPTIKLCLLDGAVHVF